MEKLFGYNGKIAYIDLSNEKIDIKQLSRDYAEKYIGGVGLSAKLMYELLTEKDYDLLKKDPLSSPNPLIFATGPLTGTATPSSSRYSVSGISPLTGIWGESTSGGYFPIALRKSGFDAIIITGKGSDPKFLLIKDGKITFQNATSIWGSNTKDTINKIKRDVEDDKIRVACIGKSGENSIKYAAIINDDGRAAGRCGIGAIMGSKNLKAIAVKATKINIEYADRSLLVETGNRANKVIQGFFPVKFFSNYGTLIYSDIGMVMGDIPVKYFTETEFVAEDLTGKALCEKYPVLKYACAGCRIGCGKKTFMKDQNGKEIEIDGPEYETMAAFGPLCGIFDFEPILKANHICNLEGLDTISCGVSIAFLIYLVENKIGIENIKRYLTDIRIDEIHWGNEELIIKLIKKIINKEDIGALLAEGVKIMAEKLEVDPELAAHVKGLEIPMHEPRAYVGQALSYCTCVVGASHEKGDFFNIDGNGATIRKIKMGERFDIDGREKYVIMLQDLANIYDSAVICNFPHLDFPFLTKLFVSSTGFDSLKNWKNLILTGERANNLKRLISCKLGITREDDSLPQITKVPLESGGCADIKLDLKNNLKKYYEIRGWDWVTGFPTEEKLAELGI
ncbi:MAG: aldehyde ferredoxin oxidoreductase [Promethearchaeota archaeon]|nr:MAG: aldehyde ferredoxin oxidoreductase [Candidatus Lokiarchaeota archaeon]